MLAEMMDVRPPELFASYAEYAIAYAFWRHNEAGWEGGARAAAVRAGPSPCVETPCDPCACIYNLPAAPARSLGGGGWGAPAQPLHRTVLGKKGVCVKGLWVRARREVR